MKVHKKSICSIRYTEVVTHNVGLSRSSYVVVYRRLLGQFLHGYGHRVHRWLWPTLVRDSICHRRYHHYLHQIAHSHRWGLIVSLLIAAIFLPFVVTVYAITGQTHYSSSKIAVSLTSVLVSAGFVPNIQNLVQVVFSLLILLSVELSHSSSQILGAAMLPGSPQTNMYFTLYGYNTVDQARGLIRDLKMVSTSPKLVISTTHPFENRASIPSYLPALLLRCSVSEPSS